MQELYEKLKKYSIEDSIKIEESDRQYIALKKMLDNLTSPQPSPLEERVLAQKFYLGLILANSIICYQLSGKGEDYWEEFGAYFVSKGIMNNEKGIIDNIINGLSTFIKQSKNNKRFVDTKINRLEKLRPFLEEFVTKTEYYYNNMEELRDKLALTMKQKKDAKTVVFAIKMFSYGARNVFNKLIYFPENISIPIDSRLDNLFQKYKDNPPLTPPYKGGGQDQLIKKFYFDLSKKLNIPELHLDALVWVNYDELIN